MKAHFLKSIFRSIAKKPLIYSINFIGLMVSMAVVIILAVYCYGEITANRFNKNINNTYIVCSKGFNNELQTYTPAILKEQIEAQIPEVEKVVRMRSPWRKTALQIGENQPVESNIIFADSAFADVFSYQCIAGDLRRTLKTPMSIVLTSKEASKLFGQLSPIGQTIKVDNKQLLTVGAVIDEPKAKSSLSFDAIVPMMSISRLSPNGDELTSWKRPNFTSFIIVKSTANPNEVGGKIARFYSDGYTPEISLQPFKSFYFSDVDISRLSYLRNGNKTTTMILGFVAVIILFMGIINYLNLSSSMIIEKLKNTGIMKVIGAKKGHIIWNIIRESALFFFVSIVIAYLIAWITMPLLANQIGTDIYQNIIFKPAFLLISISLALFVATLAVSIPAIRLSSIKPIDSLKKKASGPGKHNYTKTALVVAQFTIAIILIAFTWIVQKQVKYGFKQLGYNNGNIYTIQLTPQLTKDVLKEKLEQVPGVTEVAYTDYLPKKETITMVWNDCNIQRRKERKY